MLLLTGYQICHLIDIFLLPGWSNTCNPLNRETESEVVKVKFSLPLFLFLNFMLKLHPMVFSFTVIETQMLILICTPLYCREGINGWHVYIDSESV